MSLVPAKYRLTIRKGSTFRKRLTLLQGEPGSDPQIFTGYTAEMVIKDRAGGTVLQTLSTVGGSITLGATDGSIELYLSLSSVNSISWKTGVYNLTITAPAGDTDALLYGGVVVSES